MRQAVKDIMHTLVTRRASNICGEMKIERWQLVNTLVRTMLTRVVGRAMRNKVQRLVNSTCGIKAAGSYSHS